MMTLRLHSARAVGAFLFLGLSGCGYTLQTSKSPLAEREKIESVYIAPVTNGTLRAGVETTVYNALVRNLSAHQTLRLVSNADTADSILHANVDQMNVTVSSTTPGENLLGVPKYSQYYSGIPFTTYYAATLQCTFSLTKRLSRPVYAVDPKTGTKKLTKPILVKPLWGTSFSRSQVYPAFLQTGPSGATSPTITDSELDRVLSEIVTNMMDDVHESMLNSF